MSVSKEEIQAYAERILDGEIYAVQSGLVSDLLDLGTEGHRFGLEWDSVENAYNVPPFDEVSHLYDTEEEYEEAIEEGEIETVPNDIYEWWLVSDWLAGRLREIGEPILSSGNNTWWGRTCTGQAIIQDGTLQEIAKNCLDS